MPEPRVKADIAFVRNLGNYETLRVDLSIERDVPPGVEYLDALERLYKEVSSKIKEKIEEIDAAGGLANVTRTRK